MSDTLVGGSRRNAYIRPQAANFSIRGHSSGNQWTLSDSVQLEHESLTSKVNSGWCDPSSAPWVAQSTPQSPWTSWVDWWCMTYKPGPSPFMGCFCSWPPCSHHCFILPQEVSEFTWTVPTLHVPSQPQGVKPHVAVSSQHLEFCDHFKPPLNYPLIHCSLLSGHPQIFSLLWRLLDLTAAVSLLT